MSKKSKSKRGGKSAVTPRPRRSWKRSPAWLTLAGGAILVVAITASSRLAPVRRAIGLAPLPVSTTSQQGGLSLNKEYIYAGGRLVATEEPSATTPTPTPTPAGQPPTGLVATYQSSAGGVLLSWNAPASGSVSGYVVERRGAGVDFTPLGQSVTATSFVDQAAQEGQAYLYRARALFNGGGVSEHSNSDLATAITFADDPLVSSTENPAAATPVKAVHFTQLMSAVNAVRSLAGLSAIAWTFTPQPGALIKLEELSEMRLGLGQGREALGLPAVSFTDPDLERGVTPIRKAHIQELRNAAR